MDPDLKRQTLATDTEMPLAKLQVYHTFAAKLGIIDPTITAAMIVAGALLEVAQELNCHLLGVAQELNCLNIGLQALAPIPDDELARATHRVADEIAFAKGRS